ncbi:NUDIX hydrolase [Gracilibacillus alcaliphilus]|uniref:NUDIX hydrolase n=1 Tax=Gracilibacillus alcaliphilus TaxID=1401441 RepID=UPI001957F41C|nr:NUDIX domain-containing protein [Gracilibacillus alcaliphilus]MBM7676484.1 8-oxo-dGTP diphosphatase [Gracilibacillus alcaliphilus]
MPILTCENGNVFINFSAVNEIDIPNHLGDIPLTHSLIVAKYLGKYLLLFNKWHKYWELAGGMIDKGESPRTCAARELLEETNQRIPNLQFKGLMKFQLEPDDRLEFGALYSGEIIELRPFQENEEAEQIVFWDRKSDIGYIDEIDKKLLEYY